MSNVLITGVGHNLGEDLAKSLSGLGFNVIATTRDKESSARLFKDNKKVELYEVDFSDYNSVSSFLNKIKDIDIDIFINNAFMVQDLSVEGEILHDAVEDSLNVNIISPMQIVKHISGTMKKNNSGHMFFITSASAYPPYYGEIYYTVYKRSQSALADSLRLDLKRYGIKITEIIPGSIGDNGISPSDISRCIEFAISSGSKLNFDKMFISPV